MSERSAARMLTIRRSRAARLLADAFAAADRRETGGVRVGLAAIADLLNAQRIEAELRAKTKAERDRAYGRAERFERPEWAVEPERKEGAA